MDKVTMTRAEYDKLHTLVDQWYALTDCPEANGLGHAVRVFLVRIGRGKYVNSDAPPAR